MNPLDTIQDWLKKESDLGSINPNRIVLATASKGAVPSARIIAIREISETDILFFTQRDTRKVAELTQNKQVSALIWLPQQQRQICIEGVASAITNHENRRYWEALPRDRQLRFSAYAPTSGHVIESTAILDKKYQHLADVYKDKSIPMCEYYCGFRIHPASIHFYTLGDENFSDVKRYTKKESHWVEETISP